MHVPQLPASQLNGGDRPARRALSSSVSPATRGTDAFLRSSWMVTVPPARRRRCFGGLAVRAP